MIPEHFRDNKASFLNMASAKGWVKYNRDEILNMESVSQHCNSTGKLPEISHSAPSNL